MEWVVGEFAAIIMVVTFGGIALWCFFSKDPVNFWAGDEIKPEEISDIRKYNNINGIMWTAFTIPQLAAVVIMPFNSTLAGILLTVCGVGGIIPLMFVYKAVEKKYRKKVK